jgi:trimethylamine--corrinoid protein Co-methyltransferase
MAGADMIAGIGLLEDCRTVWLEQMVIDSEMSMMIGRMARGIEVDDDTLALDVVDKVGAGRDYLGQRHTFERFRSEHFIPRISDRSSWDTWTHHGSKSIIDRARVEVERIMKEHSVEPVRSEVGETVDRLITKRSK